MHRKYRHNHFKSAKKPGRRSRHGTHGSKTAPPKPRRRQGQRERARYQKKQGLKATNSHAQHDDTGADRSTATDSRPSAQRTAGAFASGLRRAPASMLDALGDFNLMLDYDESEGGMWWRTTTSRNRAQVCNVADMISACKEAAEDELPTRASMDRLRSVAMFMARYHWTAYQEPRLPLSARERLNKQTTSNPLRTKRVLAAVDKCIQAAVRDGAAKQVVSALERLGQHTGLDRKFIEDVAFHALCVAAFHGRANTVNAIMNMSTGRPLQWQRLMCAMITSALRDGGAAIATRWGCAPPLFLAIAQGHSHVVHTLLAHNDVTTAINEAFPWTSTSNNDGDSDGAWTALGVAISCGHTSIVAQLLEVAHIALNLARRGADLSSLTLAVHRAKPDIVRLLLQHRPAQPWLPTGAPIKSTVVLRPNYIDDLGMAPIARAFAQWSSANDSSTGERARIVHMLLDDPRIDVNEAPSRRSSSASLLHAMITDDWAGRFRGLRAMYGWRSYVERSCAFRATSDNAAGTLLLACDRVDVDAKAFELAVGREGCDGALKALLARPTTADTATDCLQGIASLLGKATEAHRGGAIKLLLSSWVVDSGRLTWSEDEAGVWPPGSNAALARDQLAGPISVLTAFANSEPSQFNAIGWGRMTLGRHNPTAVCSCSSHRTFEEVVEVEEDEDGTPRASVTLRRLSRDEMERKEAAEAVACMQLTARWRRRRALALVREQRLAGQDWKVPLEAMQ